MSFPGLLKKWLLDWLLDPDDKLTFRKYEGQKIDWEGVDNLYIHIPFCRNKCPYCPYYKEIFQDQKAWFFGESLLHEIDLHAPWLQGRAMQSLYIGGGTPTLMTDLLTRAIGRLRELCSVEKIAIETSPSDISNEVLVSLHNMGCNMISLGVQDFQQKYLTFLGRDYTTEKTLDVIDKIGLSYYDTFNLDLIFAYPGQTLKELDLTLRMAMDTPAHQLTFYPLFTFPYSTVGRFINLKQVKMPDSEIRRRMYYHIYDTLLANGYEQVSVWGFLKGGKGKYSSVTREQYLGLGPSAGTYTGKQFLFNTFNMEKYISGPVQDQLPYEYIMDVTPHMERLFWVYWRLYETVIPREVYRQRFDRDFTEDFKSLLYGAEMMKYMVVKDPHLLLTKKGIHRIHLLQNHFALDFINRIWTACTQDPYPDKVPLSAWHN